MKDTEKTIAKSELNNVLKEEYKSFSMLCKVLTAKKSSQVMKDFLNQYDLKFENLVNIDYLRSGLTFATFTASDGVTTYETICRKTKDGETVPAKWSFWLILKPPRKFVKKKLKPLKKSRCLQKNNLWKKLKKKKRKQEKRLRKKQLKRL